MREVKTLNKELPKMTVAYIRHIGPYKGDDKLFESIWNRLFSWAGPRGLIGGKELLKLAIEDAKSQGKDGLVTVVGTTKFHFMSDTKWLLKQGFETYEKLSSGFSLLVRKINPEASSPKFKNSVKSGECDVKKRLVIYYSNRCPFSEYHVTTSLIETAGKRKLPLKVVKLDTMEKAQAAPTPATIFSLFYNGKFVTTDLSACMDSRFEKVVKL